MKKTGDVPTFEVTRSEYQIEFRCPSCGKLNIHGNGGSRGPNYGHRVSHCGCYPNGYFLKENSND